MIDIRGTSHIAGEDLERIRREVEEKQPDVVALELDPARLDALLHDQQGGRPRNPFFLLMKAVQDLLGRRAGVAPGSDMLTALRAAESEGIDVALIDQDIGVTLERLKAVPLVEKIKFLGFLLLSPFLLRGLDIDLQQVPEQDIVDEMLLRLRIGFPGMYRVLVAERNETMAERLEMLERRYGHVLAFVGAGHVEGVRERLSPT